MEKVKGFVKRHRKLLVLALVLIVVGALLFVLLGGMRTAQAASVAPPATTTLQRMDLQKVVTTTGTLQSTNVRQVNSSLTYEVKELLVEVGDHVNAGDTLCTLDTTDIDKSIADTQSSIATARAQDALKLEQAERKLQDAINQRDLDQNRLDGEVLTAHNALEVARGEAAQQANAQAAASAEKAAVDAAQTAVDTLNAGLAAGSITQAEYDAQYPAALAALEGATAAYNNAWAADTGSAWIATRDAYPALATAQSAYDKAVQTRDTTMRTDGINVENAQDSVNTLKLTDSTQSLRTQLESYQKQKENAVITAPISGTVTAVNAQVGVAPAGAGVSASGTASALFTIEDIASLEIPAYVPEYDAVDLKPGMSVAITSDALDGEEWKGTVQSISPTAADTSGNFLVTVKVTSPVGELTSGMSAKLNIVVDEKTNVYAVPYEAVVKNDAGQDVVYVLSAAPASASGSAASPEAGAPQQQEVAVETGLETDYYLEIISPLLEEGMAVVNDPSAKEAPAAPGGLFGGMMGG